MIINHNMNAMNAHRNMSANTVSAGKSMEKLSSGLRINRAGDDAAGLAISEKMRGQIRGLDQASRNSQDGISLIQTAEGALNETHSILQRMRELAVQSTNGTLTADDRSKIQAEADQLTSEIDKIGNQTEFNTKKLLNGEIGTTATSDNSWSDANGKVAVLIKGVTSDTQTTTAAKAMAVTTAGAKAYTADAAWGGGSLTNQTLTIQKGTGSSAVTTSIAVSVGDDQKAIVDKINLTSKDSGVEAFISKTGGVSIRSTTAGTSGNLSITDSNAGVLKTAIGVGAAQVGVDAVVTVAGSTTFSNDGNTISVTDGTLKGLSADIQGIEETSTLKNLVVTTGAALGDSITLNGKQVTFGGATAASAIATALNGVERETGVHVTESGGILSFETTAKGDTAGIVLSYNSTALNLGALGTGAKASIQGTGGSTYTAGTDNIDNTVTANLSCTAASVDFHVGANANQTMSLRVGDMRSSNLGTATSVSASFANVSELSSKDAFATAADAEKAITVLDAAISKVSEERGNLGAVQNRLEHTIANLNTSSENVQSAESRIRDVDMAKEMMNFSKNNILSQAAQAMLAQANQQPQGVLQLLR